MRGGPVKRLAGVERGWARIWGREPAEQFKGGPPPDPPPARGKRARRSGAQARHARPATRSWGRLLIFGSILGVLGIAVPLGISAAESSPHVLPQVSPTRVSASAINRLDISATPESVATA